MAGATGNPDAMRGDLHSLRNALWNEREICTNIAMPTVLSAAMWNLTPLLTPLEVQSLSFASSAVKAMVLPASERAKLAEKLSRDLRALPFGFGFPLMCVSPQALAEALQVLRPLLPLRRRELVGRDAGWAPTDTEAWSFSSEDDLIEGVKAVRLARQSAVQSSRFGPLLLGATLRLDSSSEQTLAAPAPLWTSSVGVEWAYGPASDPMQLGVRLGLHPDGSVEIDLEIGSGAWTPWAEQWTLRENTLNACLSVVVPVQNGVMSIMRSEIPEAAPFRVCGDTAANQAGGWACEVQRSEALRQALVSAGEEGLRAVVCIGRVRWQKEPPEWCPAEVQRLVLNQ